MKATIIALLLCACAAVCLAGDIGFGFGGGYGGYGGFEDGHGFGYHKTVPGPSFLVKTVHHVNKLHQGAHLVGGHYGHGGYGGGFGGGFGGFGGGFGGFKH